MKKIYPIKIYIAIGLAIFLFHLGYTHSTEFSRATEEISPANIVDEALSVARKHKGYAALPAKLKEQIVSTGQDGFDELVARAKNASPVEMMGAINPVLGLYRDTPIQSKGIMEVLKIRSKKAKTEIDISACLPLYANLGVLGEDDAEIESYLISIISDPKFLDREWPILTKGKAVQPIKIPAKPFVLVQDENLSTLSDQELESKIKFELGRNDIIVIRDRVHDPDAMQTEIFEKTGTTLYSPMDYRRYQIRACAATALFHRKSANGLDMLNELRNHPNEDDMFIRTLNFYFEILEKYGSLDEYVEHSEEVK